MLAASLAQRQQRSGGSGGGNGQGDVESEVAAQLGAATTELEAAEKRVAGAVRRLQQ